MKAFFGMTAAVLLVVTMLFAALPEAGWAEEPVAGDACNPQIDRSVI
jgi:hypothetical protein